MSYHLLMLSIPAQKMIFVKNAWNLAIVNTSVQLAVLFAKGKTVLLLVLKWAADIVTLLVEVSPALIIISWTVINKSSHYATGGGSVQIANK